MHVCQTYERAVANKPPVMQKRFWRRYIYLWRLHGKRFSTFSISGSTSPSSRSLLSL